MHAQAARDRWREEVILLKEELRRVGESFAYSAARWNDAAEAAHVATEDETRVSRGAKAYAYRQVAVYRYLESDAKRRYEDITSPYEPKQFRASSGNRKGGDLAESR